jgi:hypothetical protein
MKYNKGQAFVELIVGIPVFIFFLLGISVFTRLYLTKIVLTQASHHAMFLIVYKNYDETQIRTEVFNYLSADRYMFPNLKKKEVHVSVDLGLGWTGPAKVEIKYPVHLPNLIAKIPGFPKSLVIRGYSECYNDSWYLGVPNNLSKS